MSYHIGMIFSTILYGITVGPIVEEMLRIQKIRSVQSLLRASDVFEFLNWNSASLEQIKGKVAFRLNNGEYRIKCGIEADVDSFLQTLICISDKLCQSNPILTNMNDGTNTFEDLLRAHPILSSFIEFYSSQKDTIDQNGTLFSRL